MSTPTAPPGAQGVNDVIDTQTAPIDAVARLEQSRQRLRRCLLELNVHRDDAPAQDAKGLHSSALFDSIKSIPLVGMVLDTASSWWSQHPLRVVATLLAASAASAARPVTQRHPKWTLFAALALGGLVMWAKPWRFAPLRRAVYAGLLPQLVSKVISIMPADGWLNLAESFLRRDKTAPTSAAPAAKTAASPASPLSGHFARSAPLH